MVMDGAMAFIAERHLLCTRAPLARAQEHEGDRDTRKVLLQHLGAGGDPDPVWVKAHKA